MMRNESLKCALEEVQTLTRCYASYTRRKGGLGYVLGGVVLILVALFAGRLPPGLPVSVFACGSLFAWLIGKEALRRVLYTSFGRAVQSRKTDFFHVLRVSLGTLLIAGLALFVGMHSPLTPGQLALLAALLLAVPALSWFLLRSLSEWVSGMTLLLLCLACSFGYMKYISQWFLLALLLASLLISLGLTEHFQYRELTERLRARQQEPFSLFFFIPALFLLAVYTALCMLNFAPLTFQFPLYAAALMLVFGYTKYRQAAWTPCPALAYQAERRVSRVDYRSWKGV